MDINNLVDKYGNKLNSGELEVDSTELYGDLLDVKDKTAEDEFKYKDTMQILLGMVENGHNPLSFYDMDIINNAKRLIEEV